jgi:hypothetical protein
MAEEFMSENCRATGRLRRRIEFSMFVVALTLLAAVPSALAAGAESGTGSTTGEPVVESPGDSSEPAAPAAPAAPPATGWAPAGAGTEASSGGAAEAERGSSLGSGGAPQPAPAASPTQVSAPSGGRGGSTPAEPTYTAPSSYSEPEAAAAPSAAPSTSTPPADGGADPVKQAAPTRQAAHLDVGPAAVLARAEPRSDASAPASETAAPLSDPRDQAASGSDALPLGILFVAGLVLTALGAVAVRRWRRHRRRGQLEALWDRRQADWDAAVSQIRLERTPGHNAGH